MHEDLQRVLKKTGQDLMIALKETLPSKKFRAIIIMAMVGLHMIEARIRKTQNLEERRRLNREFKIGRNAIEKGIRALRKSSRGNFEGSKKRVGREMS